MFMFLLGGDLYPRRNKWKVTAAESGGQMPATKGKIRREERYDVVGTPTEFICRGKRARHDKKDMHISLSPRAVRSDYLQAKDSASESRTPVQSTLHVHLPRELCGRMNILKSLTTQICGECKEEEDRVFRLDWGRRMWRYEKNNSFRSRPRDRK